MKKKLMISLSIMLLIMFVFSSCATAEKVPYNASPEQVNSINAKNLEAIATNTSTLAAIQVAGLIAGFLSGFILAGN